MLTMQNESSDEKVVRQELARKAAMEERTAHRDPIAHMRTMINEWKSFHGLTTVQVVLYLAMAIGWFSETAYVDHKRETDESKT